MKYVTEISSYGMIYLISFMKIGRGVQAILRFCLRNLRGCYVDITEGKELLNHAVKMGSGAAMYVLSFIKIGSGIQTLIWGDAQTTR
jgi:hypothetical protein